MKSKSIDEILASGVTLDRLVTLSRVVAHGSIAEAADRDPNRQSQYSRQIRDLEFALGKKLFQRKGKRMSLSPEGRRLTLIASSFFRSLEDFRGPEEMTELIIGGGESLLELFIHRRFGNLREALPKTRIDLRSLSTVATRQAIDSGEIDLALLRQDAAENLEVETLGILHFSLFIPRSSFPDPSAPGLETLESLEIATLGGSGSYVRSIPIIARAMGLEVDTVARATSFGRVAEMAKAASLAAFLPVHYSAILERETFAEIRDERMQPLQRNIVMAASPSTSTIRPSVARTLRRLGSLLQTDEQFKP